MKYIVYLTVNTVNNKIYIGVHQTDTPHIFDGYIGCGIANKGMTPRLEVPFHRAVRKYGYDKFVRHTLKIFDNPEEAYFLERELVDEPFVQSKDTYNATIGGTPGGGYTLRKSILQYTLSGKFVKEWNSITEAAMYFSVDDSTVSPGTLAQALQYPFKSRCGFQWRYYSEDFPQYIGYYGINLRVAQYTLDGELVKVWVSVKEAAKSFGKESGDALRTYAGNHKIYEGFQWRLVKQRETPTEFIEIACHPKSIVQLTTDGILVKEWDNQQQLSIEFKNVRDALNGRLKTYKGFKWMYKKDYVNKDIQLNS